MKSLIIKCPTCSKKHDYYQSKPWSPFCSDRCRLIDLGAWAGEEHRIRGKSVPLPETGGDQEQSKTDDFSDHDRKFIN